ncbi:MAG TPA: DUF2283 domain-containing protein [Solirubrobacterales bacterium]|nr:DUF2283 domain-containing protein [Solirubrobacterales bacterium]
MTGRFAYYDRDADIAWVPTGESAEVVSQEVEWGLIDHDVASDEVVAIEIWSASKRLPADLLETLPSPQGDRGAAA